jgi:predicted RNA binding protein YcfA (HicA-like mRNA interferase family)
VPRLIPVHWRKLVCVLEKEGFTVTRQRGDHIIMTSPSCLRPAVIPQYRDVPVFVIRNILRTAGMGRERYFELLAEC